MPALDDFLQPKSMLTPGVAGALTMGITNALTGAFAVPANWTALGLSLLLALVTVAAITKVSEKVLYTLLNGLVIFMVAVGSNTAGFNRQRAAGGEPETRVATVTTDTTATAASTDSVVADVLGADVDAATLRAVSAAVASKESRTIEFRTRSGERLVARTQPLDASIVVRNGRPVPVGKGVSIAVARNPDQFFKPWFAGQATAATSVSD